MLSVSRLFAGYPGSVNVRNETLAEYAKSMVRFPPEYLDRVTDRIRSGVPGITRNTEFVPSIDTFVSAINQTPMTDAEGAAYRRINDLPEALPAPEPRQTTWQEPTPEERARVQQMVDAFNAGLPEPEEKREFDLDKVNLRFNNKERVKCINR